MKARVLLWLLVIATSAAEEVSRVGRRDVNVNVNVNEDHESTGGGFLSFSRSEVNVIKKLIELKLWFLKLIAKFLDSAGDGVQVHIGTSSGHRGGDPSIRVNVKGNNGGAGGDDGRRWWSLGERIGGGGIRLNIDTADKRKKNWWDRK